MKTFFKRVKEFFDSKKGIGLVMVVSILTIVLSWVYIIKHSKPVGTNQNQVDTVLMVPVRDTVYVRDTIVIRDTVYVATENEQNLMRIIKHQDEMITKLTKKK